MALLAAEGAKRTQDAGNHHRSRWTPADERQADRIAEAELERRPKHRHSRKSSPIGTRVGTRHLTNRCYGEGLAVTPSHQKANKTAFGGTIGQGEGLISSPFKTGALIGTGLAGTTGHDRWLCLWGMSPKLTPNWRLQGGTPRYAEGLSRPKN